MKNSKIKSILSYNPSNKEVIFETKRMAKRTFKKEVLSVFPNWEIKSVSSLTRPNNFKKFLVRVKNFELIEGLLS